MNTMNVILVDQSTENLATAPRLEVEIRQSHGSIEICPKGYGTKDCEDGHGCPLYIEFYQGKLHVLVNPDINEEEPQVIDMEPARESNRKPD